MPPFNLICELIDCWLMELPIPAAVAAAIADPATPWPRLVTLSGVHLMTPAFAAALATPALAAKLPDELRLYLAAMREAATERNQRLRAQLEHVAARVNEIDVIPVALKGAIRLVDGLWPDIGLRFMHDLDLLVPAGSVERCRQRLVAEDWQTVVHGEAEGSHHVVLVHPRAEVRVELHTQPLAGAHDRLLPATRMLARARPAAIGQAMIALPTPEDQLVHLVAHGMLQHEFLCSGRFLLRDLVEQALLVQRADHGELESAGDRFARLGRGRTWDVSAALTARCLPRAAGGWARPGYGTRLLVDRMLLQQRSPAFMQLLGPVGWAVARAIGIAAGDTAAELEKSSLRHLGGRLQLFRRKTRW